MKRTGVALLYSHNRQGEEKGGKFFPSGENYGDSKRVKLKEQNFSRPRKSTGV